MTDVAPEVAIRGYRPDDDEPLLELFRVSFDGWPKVGTSAPGIDHLRWKNRGHPRAPQASVVAEAADGRLAGASMQWVFPVLVHGETRLATSGIDTCVHPEFRGRDVYTRLRQKHATYDPWVDCRIGTTVNEFIKRKRESFGYRYFGNPAEELTWRPGALRERLERATQAMGRASRRRPKSQFAGMAGNDGAFEEAFDPFATDALRPFSFAPARTFAQLRWRHFDPRGGPAELRVIRDSSGLAGYSVLRARARRGYLADLLVRAGDAAAVRAIARDGVARLRELGYTVISVWLPRVHPYRAPLLAEGFRPTGRTIDLRYQPVAMPLRELAFLDEPDASFHFTIGDTDLV